MRNELKRHRKLERGRKRRKAWEYRHNINKIAVKRMSDRGVDIKQIYSRLPMPYPISRKHKVSRKKEAALKKVFMRSVSDKSASEN